MPDFLKGTPARIVSVLLLLQIATFYAYPTAEVVPLSRPLKDVPTEVAGWQMVRENPVSTEVQDLLRADDSLSRAYFKPSAGVVTDLWVAFYRTQKTGVSPHSPKVCLPGTGWIATSNSTIQVAIPGMADPITVNRYVVTHEDNVRLVLYWYQSFNRVIAGEYAAKVYTVLDGLRYHRSDTSMVRVMVPVIDANYTRADEQALKFVQDFFLPLKEYLPK